MAVGDRTDPYLAFNFLVEIDGVVAGGFSEVTGLEVEVEVHDYREGGVNGYVHRLAGPARYPSNLVLKHGMTDVDALWKWHQEVTQGTIQRKNGSIVLLDAAGEEKWRWNFVQAYPVKWTGPELRATSAVVAVETVELVHRGIAKAR
ncbi:MAG: phage tail protein [Deltaproteobacteria bacterium]|nr:phage tail protein [Deltaproteobacteria bacterium]